MAKSLLSARRRILMRPRSPASFQEDCIPFAPGGANPPLAATVDAAFALQFLQHGLQRDAVGAGDMEGAGDLALADRRRALADEFQELLLRRKRSLLLPSFGHIELIEIPTLEFPE